MRKNQSILYVNYSPYENSGKILDYLLEEFKYVFMFSIGFYDIDNKQRVNRFVVYKNAKLINKKLNFRFIVPNKLAFLFLPISSIVNFLQIIFYSILMNTKYGKVDVYFTVNGFTAWIGNMLRWLGVVRRSVYWVWDYYPINHDSQIIRVMRWLYWKFDKTGVNSDRLVFLNKRLANIWKQEGLIGDINKYPYVPIGTHENPRPGIKKSRKEIKIGFIGVLKKSQGIEVIFRAAKTLRKKFPGIVFEIIGSGPDYGYFKSLAKEQELIVNFHGHVEEGVFEEILAQCNIGIAPYITIDSNVSRFGDPGKIKRYLSFSMPAITTNVFEFSEELVRSGAGVIFDYNNPEKLAEAIETVMKDYKKYQRNADKLNKKFYYRKVYKTLFDF